MATNEKQADNATVIVEFDKTAGRYRVDSGPWLEQGFVNPKPGRGEPPKEGSGPGGTGQMNDEDLMRCLRSQMSGHVSHCHWHVWDGSSWVDTGKHGCACV